MWTYWEGVNLPFGDNPYTYLTKDKVFKDTYKMMSKNVGDLKQLEALCQAATDTTPSARRGAPSTSAATDTTRRPPSTRRGAHPPTSTSAASTSGRSHEPSAKRTKLMIELMYATGNLQMNGEAIRDLARAILEDMKMTGSMRVADLNR